MCFPRTGGRRTSASTASRSIGSRVAAGTTVTKHNLPHLTETLGIVATSAAHTWGLHLLVPEGRARCAPDLHMGRGELRRLVRFVEEKRNYVSVEMADELGFCGDREPLLRDPCRAGDGTSSSKRARRSEASWPPPTRRWTTPSGCSRSLRSAPG